MWNIGSASTKTSVGRASSSTALTNTRAVIPARAVERRALRPAGGAARVEDRRQQLESGRVRPRVRLRRREQLVVRLEALRLAERIERRPAGRRRDPLDALLLVAAGDEHARRRV